jgi:hypothetical protein
VEMKTDATFTPDGSIFRKTCHEKANRCLHASGTLHFLIILSLVTVCPCPLR